MVQGEINTAITPSSVTNGAGIGTAGANMKLYENLNEDSGEKKKKVGNYIISKTIGEGSFAKVRLGYHLNTQQMVAVKVINKREVLKRNYLRANLRREACMMQRMQHPHIIKLYEVMETENCYYIVMELIDGIEFVKYLSKKRSLDENETREYIRQIVSAVDHMHKAKVIHRDIKLQNFMLDQNRNLTIIDFGLSNSLDDRDFLNTQCGSPAYAAPEIFAHQDYGAEVDIWSIGVNMYAMLAGRLPFKVENRSKNLAKLHACILKGFEVPPFLSPDCQDLLCRLLEPSPGKRIKMSEILNHPWLNYNTVPIEIIPYKPSVDLKEIRREIVQYLVQKHDYAESDVMDAIVHRKPVALKAIYYLIEKRLKQGLSFPDPDYNGLLRTTAVTDNNPISFKATFKASNQSIDSVNQHTVAAGQLGGLTKQNSQLLPKRHSGVQLAQRSSSQKNADYKSMFNNMNISNATSTAAVNGLPNRTSSVLNNYKDIDLTTTNGTGLLSNNLNQNNSNSPSPDFIAAAMSPMKTSSSASNANVAAVTNSASSARNSRLGMTSATSNNNNDNGLSRKLSQTTGSAGVAMVSNPNRISYPMSSNQTVDYREPPHRYYAPSSAASAVGGTSNSRLGHRSGNSQISNNNDEENYEMMNGVTNRNSAGLKVSQSVAGSIRSLPSSLYRGSPERVVHGKSPDRQYIQHQTVERPTSRVSSSSRTGHHHHHHHSHYMPDGSVASSSGGNEKSNSNNYDLSTNQKLRMVNYLATKKSGTISDDPPGYMQGKQRSNAAAAAASGLISSQSVKNRQLHMGKAKIDLETQNNLNVGVSLKNIGNYLKSSLVKNLTNSGMERPAETIKSINLKSSVSSTGSYGHHRNSASSSASSHNNNILIDSNHTSNNANSAGGSNSRNGVRQSTNLMHRHSNPLSSYTNTNVMSNHHNHHHGNSKTRLQANGTDGAALPRIRINS